MRALLVVPFALSLVLVACSPDVTDIHADSTSGTATGAGGHGTQGAGGGSTTGAGGSTSACCAEPVHVAGHVKTITADSDPAQLVGKLVQDEAKLVEGPFVLTDFFGDSVSFANGPSCAATVQKVPVGGDGHGLHVYVPAGMTLCHNVGNTVVFSGFRPY